MIIRKLTHEDMREAVGLRVLCWAEETAGLTKTCPDLEAELAFFTEWMDSADDNDDVRLLLGAFEDNKMLGVVFGSFVKSKSRPQDGIELNGLWVYPDYRGRGLSFALLHELLTEFLRLGATEMIVYNYHFAPSNTFYRHLGCEVVDDEYQTADRIPTDIFSGNICTMLDKIRVSEAAGSTQI